MNMKNKILSFLVLSALLAIAPIGLISPLTPQLQATGNNNRVDVFVSFDRTPGPADAALIGAFGGRVAYVYSITPAIAANIPESAINGLLRNPHITAVELDSEVYALDAELDDSWGVKRIGAGTVHNNGNKGLGVKIGIIDSGINYNHPDLDGVYAGGYDFVQNDSEPMDVYGHGTHVAGTACAEDNDFGVVGVAPSCALYSLRVLNNDGVGSWSATIAAMDWAVKNNLQVVNLSLGSSRNPGTAVKTAFDNAEKAGVVIAAAAGNSGNNAGKGNNIIYPAKYASVIAVGATDSTDKRASFSSTGSELEIMAPGVSVLSTWNDDTSYLNPQPICLNGVCYYKYGSGTSMASPHVAGVAALVIASGTVTDTNSNGRINDEVRAKLDSTATDLGTTGKDTQYGYGLVNAASAVAP
ncbi:MAG: Subtilisin [Parcubacteria group bacterium GW2011_GWB1_41_6]|nr:MAG: Subtilisin [Parcubacteria group bacterium GW2011_GWB1_41_6]